MGTADGEKENIRIGEDDAASMANTQRNDNLLSGSVFSFDRPLLKA